MKMTVINVKLFKTLIMNVRQTVTNIVLDLNNKYESFDVSLVLED